MTTTKTRPLSSRNITGTMTFATTTTVLDSGNSFTQADVGKTITSAGNVTPGTTIASVQSAGSATMSAAGLAAASAQSCVIGADYGAVTLDSVGCVTSQPVTGLPYQQAGQVAAVINEWHNVAGAGAHGALAAARGVGVSIALQDS
jgi:hypothetical protein